MIFFLCIGTNSLVFAADNQQNKEYRIWLEASGGNFDWNAWREYLGCRAGWGSTLHFVLYARESIEETQMNDNREPLKADEKSVKGVRWDAVLPDGTIIEPYSVNEEADPRHFFDDAEDWMMEVAYFEIPFEMTGIMTVRASLNGDVVAEYEVEVLDRDMDDVPIREWVLLNKKMYFIKPNGNLARGWFHNGGKWYYFNRDGVMQTGWRYLSYNGISNWYYFKPEYSVDTNYGKMLRGWHEIDGTWYYFHKDGSMASNEWVGGYWLSRNGAWKYQPKGRWRKNSKGWWFEDERGWYPKGETVKINGVTYTFDEKGYLVE